jgi:hypothetical protein
MILRKFKRRIWCYSCNAFVFKDSVVQDENGTWNHGGYPERLYWERMMYNVGKHPREFHPMFSKAQTKRPA